MACIYEPRPRPVDEHDCCPRCGGSFEKTGGKPKDAAGQCQLCTIEDWLDEEEGG